MIHHGHGNGSQWLSVLPSRHLYLVQTLFLITFLAPGWHPQLCFEIYMFDFIDVAMLHGTLVLTHQLK